LVVQLRNASDRFTENSENIVGNFHVFETDIDEYKFGLESAMTEIANTSINRPFADISIEPLDVPGILIN
jgi:hypothetical protein